MRSERCGGPRSHPLRGEDRTMQNKMPDPAATRRRTRPDMCGVRRRWLQPGRAARACAARAPVSTRTRSPLPGSRWRHDRRSVVQSRKTLVPSAPIWAWPGWLRCSGDGRDDRPSQDKESSCKNQTPAIDACERPGEQAAGIQKLRQRFWAAWRHIIMRLTADYDVLGTRMVHIRNMNMLVLYEEPVCPIKLDERSGDNGNAADRHKNRSCEQHAVIVDPMQAAEPAFACRGAGAEAGDEGSCDHSPRLVRRAQLPQIRLAWPHPLRAVR